MAPHLLPSLPNALLYRLGFFHQQLEWMANAFVIQAEEDVYHVLEPALRMGLEDPLAPHAGGVVHHNLPIKGKWHYSKPDYVALAGLAKLLLEAKTPYLGGGNLRERFLAGDKSAAYVVHQLAGYLVNLSVRYGVISTYHHTWCVRLDEDNRLAISPVISWDAAGPHRVTFHRAIAYMWHLAQTAAPLDIQWQDPPPYRPENPRPGPPRP
jgi:hypothetical protein